VDVGSPIGKFQRPGRVVVIFGGGMCGRRSMLLGISTKSFHVLLSLARLLPFPSLSALVDIQLLRDATQAQIARRPGRSPSGIPISSWGSAGRSSGWMRHHLGRCLVTSWRCLATAIGGSTRWVGLPWWAVRAADSCPSRKGVFASKTSRSACTDAQTLCTWATLCLVCSFGLLESGSRVVP
jgi:hypothetical protein